MSWPISTASLPDFKYVSAIILSSGIDTKYISATKGKVASDTIFTPSTASAAFFQPGESFIKQSVLNLQTDSFALAALNNAEYSAFVPGLLSQFGIVSTIITSLLAYGNTDNLDTKGFDLVTQWPHDSPGTMLTLNDAMTYSMRLLGTDVTTTTISEWRWIYPNRSRCVNPTAAGLFAMISVDTTISNTAALPSGNYRWDMLRYEFFGLSPNEITNSLLTISGNGDLLENNVFTLIYDPFVAPGCILLQLKDGLNYDDGTGSIDPAGANTSRRLLPAGSIFRVGLEWIENFISQLAICRAVSNLAVPALLLGGDLVVTLRIISSSYLGCKRLYLWDLFRSLATERLTVTGTVVTIKNNKLGGGTASTDKGLFLCLLQDATAPAWSNFFTPPTPDAFDLSYGTLVCLTSIEITAYLTPTLNSEGITENKYGIISIITDADSVPVKTVDLSTVPLTVDSAACYSASSCWSKYSPDTSLYKPPPTKSYTTFYIVLIIVIVIIVILIIYYLITSKEKISTPV
jgi:hypothetical protein